MICARLAKCNVISHHLLRSILSNYPTNQTPSKQARLQTQKNPKCIAKTQSIGPVIELKFSISPRKKTSKTPLQYTPQYFLVFLVRPGASVPLLLAISPKYCIKNCASPPLSAPPLFCVHPSGMILESLVWR